MIVADILGDGREELVTGLAGELRIYSSNIPSLSSKICLMLSYLYRMAFTDTSMGYCNALRLEFKLSKISMKKMKELIKSPHIQIALVTGICIIVIAWFSKRIIERPVSNLETAVPPFLMALYEGFSIRFKDKKIVITWYWIIAIIAATLLIITIHL